MLITVIVAALFGFAGAELGLRHDAEMPQARKVTLSDTINQLLEQQLNLTPAQKSSTGRDQCALYPST